MWGVQYWQAEALGKGVLWRLTNFDPIHLLGYTECFVRIYCTLVRAPDLLDKLLTLLIHFVSSLLVESSKERK